MDTLTANLSAIAAAMGSKPALPTDRGQAIVETAPAGPVLLFSGASGERVALNSRRDPLGEARRALDNALAGSPVPPVVVLVGLGLGYLVDALEERSGSVRIVAIEPEPACVRPFLERRDLTGLIASGRLLMLWGPDYAGDGEGWRFFEGAPEPPLTILHPVLRRLAGDRFSRAVALADRMAHGARANADARRKFSGLYLLNTLQNLPAIAHGADVAALAGLFPGVPAVVVAAGPSLDRNVAELKAAEGRAVVVATDTALRPLLANGVGASLVVSVDPQEENGEHLLGLPECPATWLVGEGAIYPAVFEAFRGRAFAFEVSGHEPWPWLGACGLRRGRLRAWGSVLVSAYDLALVMGCDPILVVGADMAYTGGQPYCRGTTAEERWAEFVAAGVPLRSVWSSSLERGQARPFVDLAGLPNATNATFEAFRDWFVQESLARTDRRILNATGRGNLAGGRIQQVSLVDVLSGRPCIPAEELASRIEHARGSSVRPPGVQVRLGEAPIDRWRQFTLGTVGGEEIRAVLRSSLDGIAHPSRPARRAVRTVPSGSVKTLSQAAAGPTRRVVPSGPHWPERVAAVRVVSAGEGSLGDAVSPASATADRRPERGRAVREATRAVCRLLERGDICTRIVPGFAGLSGAERQGVSLTAAFEWLPSARSDVETLEHWASLVEMPRDGRTPTAEEEYLFFVPPTVQGPAMSAHGERVPISPDVVDRLARRALVVEWARIVASAVSEGTGPRGFATHLAAWIAAVSDTPYPAAMNQSSAVLRADVRTPGEAGARLAFDLQAPLWRIVRGLTGTLVSGDDTVAEALRGDTAGCTLVDTALDDGAVGAPSGARLVCELEPSRRSPVGAPDPRTRFLAPPRARIRPRLLDCATAHVTAELEDEQALVTPRCSRRSIVVTSSGDVVEGHAWPHPIVGEMRWGERGSLAWCCDDDWYLMRRRAPGLPAEVTPVPFRPMRALAAEDGTTYWSASTGGLWMWPPGGGVSLIVPTAPIVGLSWVGAGLRLDALALDQAGQGIRYMPERAWIWRYGSSALEEIETGPLGPVWKVARAERRWARVHPYADTICLGVHDDVRLYLACERPRDAAWAGESLLVTTMEGRVLLFRDVAGLL